MHAAILLHKWLDNACQWVDKRVRRTLHQKRTLFYWGMTHQQRQYAPRIFEGTLQVLTLILSSNA
jgi:hypothetical protein